MMCERFVILSIILALAHAGDCTPALAQTRGHLYVVIATDENDENVGAHVQQDRLKIEGSFGGNVDKRDLTITKVDADSLSPRTVLDAIKAQPAGPNDTLFVYYSGHGAYHPTTGQYFWLGTPKQSLLRQQVRDAIDEKNSRLGIIISDCCYNLFNEPPTFVSPAAIVSTKPLFDELFFKSSGFVDITAAKEGQFAMCHPQSAEGSIFTNAFEEVLWDESENRLSWKRVFELTRDKTAAAFSEVHPQGVKARDSDVVQRTQTAWAFEIPD